jgi:autotransporter-associated beta strand protein
MHFKTPTRFKCGCPAAAVVALTLSLSALHSATIDKEDNADNLGDSSSWVGGSPPTPQDVARWGSSVTAANSAALGADLSWRGIIIADPAGAVGVLAGNTLTLGRSGIDMSAATQDLSISSGLSLLTNTHQVWNVGTGRGLNLNTGAFVRGANATLNVQGGGVVTTTMTGLSKTTLVNNIIGPWASFGTGSATTYATINASDAIIGLGYIGGADGTAVGDASGLVSGAGNNYSVAAGGGSFGGSLNTLRYTGGDGTITITTNTTSFNGVMNAGTGTLTLSSGRITTGNSDALVFNAATGNIRVGVGRLFGKKIVKTGANELLISAADSGNWTQGLFVNEGTVTALHSTLAGNGYQLGNGGGVNVASGATVNMDTFENTSLTYRFGALTGAGTVNVNTNSGSSVIRFSGSLSGFVGVLNVGYKGTGGKVVLDALAAGVGAAARINVATRGTLQVEGGINVEADLTLAGGDTSESLGQLRLEDDSTYSGDVILAGSVAAGDYTIGSNAGVGGTISGNIGETGGSWGLRKGGAGTVALTGTNTYTGATLVGVGNLQVGKNGVGSTHASSLVSVNGTTAILSGTGTLNGATTVVKGTIRPGDAGGQSRGTLSFGNGLTFSPTAVATVAELSIHGTSLADQTGDRIHITGDFTLNDKSNIVVTFDNGFVATAGQSWTLIDWTGVLTLNGWNLGLLQRDGSGDTNSNFDLPDISTSGLYWEISALQDGATGGAIVISIAPEPSRWLLLVCSAMVFALRRRRTGRR